MINQEVKMRTDIKKGILVAKKCTTANISLKYPLMGGTYFQHHFAEYAKRLF